MATECRYDCEYYSNYTDTCDYTLLMYESRGCPIDACTRYKPRTRDRRAWSICRAASTNPSATSRADRQSANRVTAACGHEVYDGENMYESEGGTTLCPECVDDAFEELSTEDKAALMGYRFIPVRVDGAIN